MQGRPHLSSPDGTGDGAQVGRSLPVHLPRCSPFPTSHWEEEGVMIELSFFTASTWEPSLVMWGEPHKDCVL